MVTRSGSFSFNFSVGVSGFDTFLSIHANPKDMKVKNSTPRYSPFVQLPQDIIDNVINWKNDLIQKHDFKDKSPLFPKIPNSFNWQNLLESAVQKEEIKSSSAIRNVFEAAFKAAAKTAKKRK